MLSTAFSLAIVGYVVTLAMGRTLAAKHGYDVDPNQEMLALGCSNFLGSFFKIHVICCALSVTLAVDSAGGSSQSVLGALIAVNLKNTLLQLSDPFYLWKKSKLECCVWVVSFLATFFLSLPYGVAVGVGFSILVVIFQTQFRNGSEVGQIMDTDIYKNPKVYSKVQSLSGVKIVCYCSPLYFANADIFRQKVIKKTGLDPGKLLLARKKFLKKQTRELKLQENAENVERRRTVGSLLFMKPQTTSQLQLQQDFHLDEQTTPTSYVNFHCDDTDQTDQRASSQPPSPITMETHPVPFHTLVLDLAGVSFIDLMGIKVLTKMKKSYEMLGISFYLANVQAQVYEELEAGGVFEDGSITRGHLFLSVHDAILSSQHRAAAPSASDQMHRAKTELAFDMEEEEKDLEQELF
ncbi:hypothetical protein AALO_G00059550 [Alosa alosa]|uniref:STAS domain-containing protein n=1 Tax=Alosa alosa TaxID=278164 RepID=A0AAV6H6F8_9TELE|nr:hypothetical protein AALO_G00059550 [Alosa alosa]